MKSLAGYQNIHLIGIGGIGMSGLASLLKHAGKKVTGSDLTQSRVTEQLGRKNISVMIGHKAANIPEQTELVVISQAVHESNPELRAAQKLRIPIWTYPEAVSALTKGKTLITISGTHGKTTTTAMIGHVLRVLKKKPTILVGSMVKQFNGNAVAGKGRYFVLEADEFAKSFLEYEPDLAVILNIDRDHLDTYHTLANIVKTFHRFYGNLRRGGTLIVNTEDPDVQRSLQGLPTANQISYGLSAGEYHATEMVASPRFVRFVVAPDKVIVTLRLHGIHNVSNALAAYAACRMLRLNPKAIARALGSFLGTGRRFERVGSFHGAPVISDYGHHPTEIRATLAAAREAFPKRRILLAFQPHHHGRLAALFKEFVFALHSADQVILTDVYKVAGREKPVISKSGKDLWVAFQKAGGKGWYAPTLKSTESVIRKNANANDVILSGGR